MNRLRLSRNAAFGIVFLLWLVFTALYTFQKNETIASFTNLLPGLLAVGALLAAGFRLEDCFLKWGRLSKRGAVYLLLTAVFLPAIYLTGRWTGWNWTAALLYAPFSAVAQELFFRSALLPVLLAILKDKPVLAIILHAVLFALWHLPQAALTAPLVGIISVVVVTFACGILWGLQVRQDRTVYWLVGLHTLLLIMNSLFTWG
ncbi:MAG: CPBP family intramembrane metalloprotease [Anaerolineales bacterium]|nr:CPBP family intramembrane metalloprotease [Anaerolineales bacterium]